MKNWFRLATLDEVPRLIRYALALTRNREAAEDLVHDALVRAYDNHAGFRSDGNLRAWLLSIVHNAFIDDQRRRESEDRRIAGLAEIARTHEPAAQEHAATLNEVALAFADLSPEQRAVLHLIVVEGLSYQEAGEALGVPIGTIMSRLSRARAALREKPAQRERRAPLRLVGGTNDRGR